MEQIVNNLKKISIDNSCEELGLENICDKLIDVNIEYDERCELNYFLNIKIAGLSDIKKTDERYSRYLRGINNWEGCENIVRNIKIFLKIESNDCNLIKKLKLMRLIDIQLSQEIGD
jgi:hypothetical protein